MIVMFDDDVDDDGMMVGKLLQRDVLLDQCDVSSSLRLWDSFHVAALRADLLEMWRGCLGMSREALRYLRDTCGLYCDAAGPAQEECRVAPHGVHVFTLCGSRRLGAVP